MRTSKTVLPYLFQYSSLKEFLQDYVKLKKIENRNWNYSLWAKKLGLANTATLTRILTGDRTPGEEITRKLREYFGFQGREEEYFEWISLKDKSASNPALVKLIDNHIHAIRAQTSDPLLKEVKSKATRPIENPLLTLENGDLLVLCGSCNKVSASALLSPHGLELAPFLGGTLMTITVARYGDSNVGPYSEAYISFFVKPLDSGAEAAGFYYPKLWVDNLQVATFGQMIWGNPFQVGSIVLKNEEDGDVLAQVLHKEQAFVSLSARGLLTAQSSGIEQNEFYGFTSREVRQTKYRLTTKGLKKTGAFNPDKDECRVLSGSDQDQLLKKVEFIPLQWIYFEELSAMVFSPQAVT